MIHSSLPARRRQRLTVLVAALISLIATSMPGAIALGARSGATTPPNTTITSSPANPSSSTSASFSFSASKGGSTFTCQLDAGTAGSCTSPKTYPGLDQGSHTFSVFATWKGTPDPSPATYTWVVDTTAPTVPTGLAGTTPTATSANLTWTGSTDNIEIDGYDIWRDGASLTSVGTTTTYTDSTVLAGTTHSYQVRARDTAGNVSALTGTVSVTLPTPPDTIIDSGPPAGTTSASASFAFHSDLTGSTFTCKLDSAAAGACTNPMAYSGLTEGLHTFSVYATLNGIADPTPATGTWTVDMTAPSAPTGLAASQLSPTSVQLTWTAATDNLGVTGYDVFRDAVHLATLGAVTAYTDATVPTGTTPAYTLQAFDIAGNQSPMTAPVTAPPPPAPLNPALTRMTYLTDLVGLNATVNFATDRSGTVASVGFGPASGSSCSLTTVVPATKITVSVNGVFEYQWKAPLTLPAAGSYCYRAFLGTVDLLGANPAPVFQTQVPIGSTEAFSFAVFGDWGQTDATGANPYQAGVMSQIAASGARFAITTGDQGYPSGAQNDYGDLQSQLAGIFGMPFWGGVGSDLAIFPILGNHGFARNDAIHPHFGNWPEDTAVTTSGGRAQMTSYGSVNGSSPATYPDSWYAFSAGNARFYMLTATWADANVGTGSAYGDDYLAHWTATSPEYQWLQADLAAHPSGLKFAFFHYPLYSDQPVENSDTYLQGNSSLEGLLASNGVNIAFNGHAHIYERNAAATGAGRLGLVSYVTGGGGGKAQSTSKCSSIDRYAVGWSYTNNRGTACGTAIAPTSPAQVHHFLKVTINGSTVTVTPIDSTGQTFDVQTYTFNPEPDTFIDSGPAAGSASTNASFTFHASSVSASYTCTLDAGTAGSCSSPKAYSDLTQGSHTFSVFATVGGVADPLPATWTWTVDTAAPTAPTNFTGGAASPFSVYLSWTAASDNLGVTGYDIFRDGTLLLTTPPATSYVDAAVLDSSTHNYSVRARDAAGNVSTFTATIPVTTPAAPAPVFADGFESGDLSAWTATGGPLVVENLAVHGGSKAAEASTTAIGGYAKKTLASTYVDGYARVWFDVVSQTSQVNLLRFRDSADASIGYTYIETTGQLGFHNDATGTDTLSATIPTPGWHALELHILTGGAGGAVEFWLDGVRVDDLSGPVTTSTNPIGKLQIGETQTTSQVYDVIFDDAAFGTARLGTSADSAPTAPGAPTNVTAIAGNASATVGWSAPAGDGGSPITGYTTTAAPGGATCTSASLGCTVSGLTNGTSYTFTVKATNAVGSGPSSSPSNAVTPAAAATVPGAPTNVTAVGGDGASTVSWSAPASDGGSLITAYTVTGTPGGSAIVAGSSTSATVNGLTNGTIYTFTVTATNAIGPGSASSSSNAVTPTGVTGPLSFAPIADAYVSSAAKTSNFGTATTLQVGTGPTLHSYLMFDVEGLTGSFTSATLRVWTTTSGSATVQDTTSAWTETGINYNNAPAKGSISSNVSNFAAGTWISYNVTGIVSGNGLVSFEYTSASSTPISFASREDAAHAPQLVITP